MSRIPLTNPKREQERLALEKSKTPSPTDVGNEDRIDNKENRTDKYDNSKEWEKTETPDMSNGWKKDKREDNGLPTLVAAEKKARIASGLAVKLAVCLLGEKVSEEVLQHQAEAFLAMNVDSLKASLNRFAESENLYSDEKEKNEKKEEEEKAPVVKEKAPVVEEKKAPVAEGKAEMPASAPKEEGTKVEASKEIKGTSLFSSLQPMNELSASDELDGMIFSEDEHVESNVTTASEKKGVKTLGGQPKFASEVNVDLSKLWKTSPDIF